MSLAGHPARRVVRVGTPEIWARVDDHIVERLIGVDPLLVAGAVGINALCDGTRQRYFRTTFLSFPSG